MNSKNQRLKLSASVEEGPYYKAGSPERGSFAESGMSGIPLILEGRVLDTQGNPIAGAWLDFWHANSDGIYDNEGYKLRGHQYSDENGNYRLETIRPRWYERRAAHVHAKVRANDNSPVLTTQLFFPGEEKNDTDPIFEEKTLMAVADMESPQKAVFDFVVEVK